MTWISWTVREGLAEVLEGSRVSSRFEAAGEELAHGYWVEARKAPGEILLVYRERPDRIGVRPSVLVLAESDLRDFFAWSWTYLKRIRPLTAFHRVLTAEVLAQNSAARQESPSLGSLLSGCVGLILAEVATHLGARFDPSRLSLLSCEGTFGFVIARSLALGTGRSEGLFSEEWTLFRRLTTPSDVRPSLDILTGPWEVLSRLERGVLPEPQPGDADVVFEVARDLHQGRSISQALWEYLCVHSGATTPSLTQFASGSREDRVVATERLLSQLDSGETRRWPVRDFLAGLVVSLIAPGTLEHGRVLQPRSTKLPGALLWYGLCAGLQAPRTGGGSNLAVSGVALQLARELLRYDDLFDQPRADIAIEELQVLAAAPARDMMSHLRTAIPGLISIELAPGVVCTGRWPSQRVEEAGERESQQRKLFGSGHVEREQSFYQELRESLDLANFLTRRLADLLGRAGQLPGARPDKEETGGGEDSSSRRRRRRSI